MDLSLLAILRLSGLKKSFLIMVESLFASLLIFFYDNYISCLILALVLLFVVHILASENRNGLEL